MTGAHDANGRKVAALRELPQAIEPPRDLWPQIEARLERIDTTATTGAHAVGSYRSAARRRWLAAAAMVASVAVGVWIGRSLLPGTPRITEGTAQSNTPPAGGAVLSAPTPLDAAYVSDPRYQRERAALMRSLPARLAALPPPARTKVMASLATIAKAKEDLEHALGKDPSNALLQELLVDTYQDEMRVLTDVREASDAGEGI
jgi:hypothetical protein